MSLTNVYADQIKELEVAVSNVELNTNDDVRAFICNLTKLIYDHRMIGKVYEFYAEDVEYHKQNKLCFKGVDDVALNITAFLAAFPNLTTEMKSVIVQKVSNDFYKVSKRLHYHGSNLGAGKYGPPTGKNLSDDCMSMSMIHLKRIGGKWKIFFELNGDSELLLRETQMARL